MLKRIAANDPSIVEVDLRSKGLTDASARCIARGLATNTHLRRLDVGVNEIGDGGAIALAEALAKHKDTCPLEFLHMQYCQIGDDGAEALADMLNENETMLEVNLLFNTKITADQKESLRIRVNSDEVGGTVLIV